MDQENHWITTNKASNRHHTMVGVTNSASNGKLLPNTTIKDLVNGRQL